MLDRVLRREWERQLGRGVVERADEGGRPAASLDELTAGSVQEIALTVVLVPGEIACTGVKLVEWLAIRSRAQVLREEVR